MISRFESYCKILILETKRLYTVHCRSWWLCRRCMCTLSPLLTPVLLKSGCTSTWSRSTLRTWSRSKTTTSREPSVRSVSLCCSISLNPTTCMWISLLVAITVTILLWISLSTNCLSEPCSMCWRFVYSDVQVLIRLNAQLHTSRTRMAQIVWRAKVGARSTRSRTRRARHAHRDPRNRVQMLGPSPTSRSVRTRNPNTHMKELRLYYAQAYVWTQRHAGPFSNVFRILTFWTLYNRIRQPLYRSITDIQYVCTYSYSIQVGLRLWGTLFQLSDIENTQ